MRSRGHFQVRLLSLCEFRGIPTPDNPCGDSSIPVQRLSLIRRPRRVKPKGRRGLAKLARQLAWYSLLKKSVEQAFESPPDLVVMFNDAAFPYDKICQMLRRKNIPFLLVQEGIRFEVDANAEKGVQAQGKGGASAIAVFGQSSAEFFHERGAAPERIHLTGNPRFDGIRTSDLDHESNRVRSALNLGARNLLFLSNPIEFFGHCSREEKLRLVRRFVLEIDPLFEDPEFRLLFKLHGHENPQDFYDAADVSRHIDRIVVASEYELYPLFCVSTAAVMFGTTAGLEALLFGVPLGVLEIPGVGFLHDYVAEGAANGLRWNEPMSEQVIGLMEKRGTIEPAVERYLDRTLAVREGATERIGELIERFSAATLVSHNRAAARLA